MRATRSIVCIFELIVPPFHLGLQRPGKLRPLMVTGRTRLATLPDLKTATEQGVSLVASSWFAVYGPNGMPTDANGVVIDRNNPTGIPRYTDTNNNGDFIDDSFLTDTRLQPCRNAGCTNAGCHSVGGPGGNPHGRGFTSALDKTRDDPCRQCHVR